ncbi:hypothetical protein MY10362_002096 [Beauveria mimosiformis]
MSRSHPAHMLDKHTLQLQHLCQALPAQFHDLFNTGWPLVPNHIDLPENNIHVDPDSRGAEVSPFGTALGLIEVALDTLTTSGDFWRYHSAHEELRAHFWTLFYGYCGGAAGGGQGNVTSAAGSEELLGWDSYGPFSDTATHCQRMRQHCELWSRSDG